MFAFTAKKPKMFALVFTGTCTYHQWHWDVEGECSYIWPAGQQWCEALKNASDVTLPNSTDLYFWWSTQKYKYEWQRSSSWATNCTGIFQTCASAPNVQGSLVQHLLEHWLPLSCDIENGCGLDLDQALLSSESNTTQCQVLVGIYICMHLYECAVQCAPHDWRLTLRAQLHLDEAFSHSAIQISQ